MSGDRLKKISSNSKKNKKKERMWGEFNPYHPFRQGHQVDHQHQDLQML